MERMKKKLGDKVIDKVFEMIEGIDLFDQLAEMAKTIMPLKAIIEVKGKESLEVKAMIKEGSLFVKVSRVREPEKEEKPTKSSPYDPTFGGTLEPAEKEEPKTEEETGNEETSTSEESD